MQSGENRSIQHCVVLQRESMREQKPRRIKGRRYGLDTCFGLLNIHWFKWEWSNHSLDIEIIGHQSDEREDSSLVNLRIEYGSEDRYMTARKVRLNHPREFGIGYHKNSLRPVLAMESINDCRYFSRLDRITACIEDDNVFPVGFQSL